jgi:uncharacterized protein YndB with AHSA1/START domain
MAIGSSLTFTRYIGASPIEVYRAFTNATTLREWFSDGAHVEAREGGAIVVWWNEGFLARGVYARLNVGSRVDFTWDGTGEPAPTAISVMLEARDGGTFVSLTHDHIGSGEAWQRARDEIQKGWTVGLENLQSVLETGDDLRFIRRPMLGIVGGDELTPEKAAELGVPVTQGIRIDGPVEGMGAHQAGLIKNDVLTFMDGKPVTTWQSLIAALSAHQAGDRVEVIFHRGTEKIVAAMELSRRPLTEVPPHPVDLARALHAIYEQSNLELDSILAGISDDTATRPPAPGEWNAKEVIAHLIAGERDTQNWIASLLGGDEMIIFANNVDIRIKATVGVFKSTPALVDELKRAQAETVAMAATLPPEFVAHKGSYVKIGRGLLETFHIRNHMNQIRAAVQPVDGR